MQKPSVAQMLESSPLSKGAGHAIKATQEAALLVFTNRACAACSGSAWQPDAVNRCDRKARVVKGRNLRLLNVEARDGGWEEKAQGGMEGWWVTKEEKREGNLSV